MRTSIEISDALLGRARRLMRKRGVTLRQLVEEGLRRVLAEDRPPARFQLRDASFKGERGFAHGSGPRDVRAALDEINEPRVGR